MSMERLTGRKEDGHAYVIGCPEFEVPKEANTVLQSVADKCADLEDILGDTYDIDRLRELVKADKEGRCVMLPVKVGESLWVYDRDGKLREMELDSPDIRCHCKKEDNLCMVSCDSPKNGVCAQRLHNDGSDIGKTVFLTRESAEAALAKEANHE